MALMFLTTIIHIHIICVDLTYSDITIHAHTSVAMPLLCADDTGEFISFHIWWTWE